MILIIETQKIYDATFKTEEERKNNNPGKGCVLCDQGTMKEMRGFLKGAEEDFLSSIATLKFDTWADLTDAMKDMKTLPGAFFIREIKSK